MPSVTDVQQQQQQTTSNNPGKSTPPPPPTTTTADSTNGDPLSQVVSLLDKKQRNLGKRKVISKLKSFIRNFEFFSFRKNWKVIERKQKRVKN